MKRLLAGLVVVVAGWLLPPFALVRLVARLLTGVLFHVDTTRRVVALTFDDGPDASLTPRVLDALARHRVRATFFVLGERCLRNPRLVARIAGEGHELGNHTWTDERSASLPPEALLDSVRRTQDLLAPFAPVTLMRPGSGWVNRRVLAAARRSGLRCVLGSIYAHDPQLPCPRWVSWYVRRRVRPGAIIVLHEGRPSRSSVLEVLDDVLPELRRRGLRVTTVSELLACAGHGPVPCGRLAAAPRQAM